MDIVTKLQNLGFNEKQARVYFALLQLGRATAYKIANKSGMKRPTVYVILEELRHKDAVLKIPYAKKQIFIAKQPEELIQNAKSKIDSVTELIPEIRALVAKSENQKVLFYEGIDGLKQLLFYKLEMMKNNEFVGFYAYNDNLPEKLLNIVDEYNRYLKNNHISTRGFAPNHISLVSYRKTDSEYYRKIKKLPLLVYNSKVSLDVGNEFVRIISFIDLQGVIIENKFVAESMKQIFEMMWRFVK